MTNPKSASPDVRGTFLKAWAETGASRGDAYQRFLRLLDAEAYLDAAVMLVPEGMAWIIYSDGPTYDASASIGPHPKGGELMDERFIGEAATPALALLAAIMKAKNDE